MKTLLLASLLLALPLAHAQEWKQTPVLNHRLTASFPDTLEVAPMNHGLMEAENSQDSAQRIFMHIGPTRLLAATNELYAVSSKPIEQAGAYYAGQMSKQFKVAAINVQPAPRRSGQLDMAIMTPTSDSIIGGAYLLKAAVVRQTDGSLQQMSFFVSDAKAPNIADVYAAIDRVIASIAAGSRILTSGKGVVLGKGEIHLDLPVGYTASEQSGYDFTVYSLLRMVEAGEPQSTGGIYIGHAPQDPSAPKSAHTANSKALQRVATWRLWEDQGGAHGETFIGDGKNGQDIVHIFLNASDVNNRNALQKIIAATIYKPGH